MTRSRATDEERTQALTKLRTLLPPGSTVYCILRHVSRSGMQRVVDPFIIGDDKQPFRLAPWLRDLGFRIDSKRDGIVLGGCGMDMGWHLVFTLSRMLYPRGFGCIGDSTDRARRCPSNDHANGDRDYTPHRQREHTGDMVDVLYSHWHRSGEYALRAEWI